MKAVLSFLAVFALVLSCSAQKKTENLKPLNTKELTSVIRNVLNASNTVVGDARNLAFVELNPCSFLASTLKIHEYGCRVFCAVLGSTGGKCNGRQCMCNSV